MVALLCLAFQQSDRPIDIGAELKLQKPITVSIKAESINRALKAISDLVDQPIEAISTMRDRKVTIYVHDVSASTVLAKVGDVLGAIWVNDNGTFRLKMDVNAANQEKAYLQAEEEFLKGRVEKRLIAQANAVKMVAPNNAETPVRPGKRPGAPESGGDPRGQALGIMMSTLPSALQAALWRGEAVTSAPLIQSDPNRPAISNESLRVVALYNPALASFRSRPGDESLVAHALAPFAVPPAELNDLPFARTVRSWADQPDSAPSDPAPKDVAMSKSFTPVSLGRPEHYVPMPTLADQLEAMSQATEANVVADAFSVPTIFRQGSLTPLSAMDALRGMSYYVKRSAGVIEIRHPGFWRLQKFEIPDAVLEPYASRAKTKSLALVDYATLTTRLSPAQLAAFQVPGAVVTPFDPAPLTAMTPALQFYATLSPAQRMKVGGGLSLDALSPGQRTSFLQAVLQGIVMGRGEIGWVAGYQAADPASLGLVAVDQSRDGGGREFIVDMGQSGRMVRFAATALAPPPKG